MPGCPTGKMPVLRIGKDVNFDQGVADCVVFAADDRSGISWWALDDDGRFLGIGRRFPAGLNFSLLGVLPIVVRGEQVALRIAHFEGRVGQDSGHTKLTQGRSERAHDYFHDAVAANKSADHDVLTDVDKTAGADVGKSNR